MAENDIPDIITKWKSRGDFGLRPPAFFALPRRAGNSDFGLKKLAAEPKGEYKAEKENHIPQSPIRTSKSFSVPADEIRANKYDLSISRYKEIEHKEIQYEKPGVIMQKVMRLEKEISKDIDEIRTML